MAIQILQGDCRDVLKTLEPESVHSVVTDPPYELGFMGKAWDRSGVAFDPDTWRSALRVLKPGGYLLAFGGSRTYHRMASAIEDAGFEIRDQIMWLYGSGFPKSHNGQWGGTALKPAHEPIVVARKPLIGTVAANFAQHGTGGLNIDACRVPSEAMPPNTGAGGMLRRSSDEQRGSGIVAPPSPLGRWPANVAHDGSEEVLAAFPDAPGQIASASASSRKTQNVYGAMKRGNGRDGEESADSENAGNVGFKMKPGGRREDAGSAARFFYCAKASRADRNVGCEGMESKPLNWSSGTKNLGSFQGEGTNKTSPNNHPTVKPTELMRYLVRLVTPKDGVVLDPFAGSGSTGRAASIEGFDAILIELNPEYAEIARKRICGDSPLFTADVVNA